jgi:hypothetical protein
MTLLLFENDWKDVWNGAAPTEPVGAIFTKPEVTEFILDLAGYNAKAGCRLAECRLLEPSCGDGAFLTQAVRRLLDSERCFAGEIVWDDPRLAQALKACDVNIGFVHLAREKIVEQLQIAGCPASHATMLALEWVEHADFLLASWRGKFDFVIGNPPYVRIEDLPAGVMQRYREFFPTCVDRADLYIAFFEQGLHLLSSRGRLAYICANRFAKNLYGRALRQLIARNYRVRHFVNLEHTQPYVTDVSAYPCIVVLDRQLGRETRATTLECLETDDLRRLIQGKTTRSGKNWAVFSDWYPDGAPWVATCKDSFERHKALARQHPVLEDSAADTRVGIGVATGADEIFILSEKNPSIEEQCQLPLIMAGDVSAQRLDWSGHYLVNPYETSDGRGLRSLKEVPGMAAYFESHRAKLEKRHTARKHPDTWYRTIDRVAPTLAHTAKLLLPDIQNGGVIGWDSGRYYPHHNLYWITSAGWDLRALQAILRSSFVYEQVKAISVQMRGGAVRYQAQVLRRLRVPLAASLAAGLIQRLAAVSDSPDQTAIDMVTADAFNL